MKWFNGIWKPERNYGVLFVCHQVALKHEAKIFSCGIDQTVHEVLWCISSLLSGISYYSMSLHGLTLSYKTALTHSTLIPCFPAKM